LTLDGYHTKWYKHYKRAVSTDRDSEVEGSKEGRGGVLARDETDNEERHPFVDKTSHGRIHRSSKLVLTRSGTCWRDNCWYL
jgi:hypothetical protein